MKRLCLLIAAPVIVGAVLFSGCASQSNTKTEGASSESPNAAVGKNERAAAANEAVKQSRQTLWDFRKPDVAPPTEFSKAETAAVVKYLFGGGADSKIEITSRVSGSFTKPDAKETLYFVSGCLDRETERFTTDCPHVAWNTAGWIAVYDGTTPVIKIEEALGGEIVKVTDMNGDGVNEILNFSGYAGSGIYTQNGNLGQISGGKYKLIQSFRGSVSNCDEGDLSQGKHAAQAAVVTYFPATDGKMPALTEEFFETGCDEDAKSDSQWKKITKKEFDDFFDAHS